MNGIIELAQPSAHCAPTERVLNGSLKLKASRSAGAKTILRPRHFISKVQLQTKLKLSRIESRGGLAETRVRRHARTESIVGH
jgi:hypothetical protein